MAYYRKTYLCVCEGQQEEMYLNHVASLIKDFPQRSVIQKVRRYRVPGRYRVPVTEVKRLLTGSVSVVELKISKSH